MGDTVIRVENLSKKYVLNHQENGKGYKTFREALTGSTKSLLKSFNKSQSTFATSREEFWALKDVSFDIQQGDRVGIIGRNGAGKSTLLKILSRITDPTHGRIKIRGRVASLLEVGTGFHPELTGRENIYLNGAILGMSREEIKRKFDEIVDFAEVEKFLDTPVKRYSSGMYVRLAFAVAAHLEPEILVIDEVLAVGDAQFQKKCLGKMEEAGKSGKTVLFVSHNMATVQHLCQKALFLEKGCVMMQGNAVECISAYVNRSGTRLGKLTDYQKVRDSCVQVIGIEVNGVSSDSLTMSPNDRLLEIDMTIFSKEVGRISLEMRLTDKEGNCLAISKPGFTDPENNTHRIQLGLYKLSSKILLPNLNKGIYMVDLWLTDPGCKGYIDFPSAIELEILGNPTKTGMVFEQSLSRDGFQSLDGSVTLQAIPSVCSLNEFSNN